MMSKISSTANICKLHHNPELQQKVLSIVPVEELKERARNNPARLPSLEDELIVQLLHWFKEEFFTWVNNDVCSHCNSPNTARSGRGIPNQTEAYYLASVVELYRCNDCGNTTRFPRYNHPSILLDTRKGRCGEWANCFTLICVTLGYKARQVMDWSDHIWTEVYSEDQDRYIHCDSCEDSYDNPLMYELGWNKKQSYVIGVSGAEAMDVTRRYTADVSTTYSRRTLVPEAWLLNYLDELTSQLLIQIDMNEQHSRKQIRMREYSHLLRIDNKPEDNQNVGGRISGSKEWRESRGELGTCETRNIGDIEGLGFSYADFKDTSGITILGDAEELNGVVFLTKDRNDQTGGIWKKEKHQVTEFQTAFNFQIGPNKGADGFAFVIQNCSQSILGTGGGGMGYDGIPKSVAIEFDTYQTWDRTKDPNSNHISIHSRGNDRNSSHHDYSLCCSPHNTKPLTGDPHYVLVTYSNKHLEVFMDDEVMCSLDIDIPMLVGGNEAWIGFTGATGGLNQNHSILNWRYNYYLSVPPMLFYDQTQQLESIKKALVAFDEGKNLAPQFDLVDRLLENLNKFDSPFEETTIDMLISMMEMWPLPKHFPILDILRLVVLSDQGAILLSQKCPFVTADNIIKKMIDYATGSNFPCKLLSLKFLVNSLGNSHLGLQAINSTEELLDIAVACAHAEKDSIKLAGAKLIFNLSVYILREEIECTQDFLTPVLEMLESNNPEIKKLVKGTVNCLIIAPNFNEEWKNNFVEIRESHPSFQ
eukprot:TRINITY_DN10381_c0_g1_i1.p1 TRINITY_DN10381_c0_g1~~TRINITY_DN10381_c0_g1_i1.p1  ORF type:complete len:840 (-),score=148.00 TRINITY_DN10381_c0_g1_i1:12-2291(-)